jgi:DNA repair exonuclease SbcCD ATPase subunit
MTHMARSYADAVQELYQSPQDGFVAQRKRLSAELKAAGDKAGAAHLVKLGRPTLSAWAVNQLWWQARAAFDALFASAERLRAGDLGAAREHRDALATLRGRAATLLAEAGHASTDPTLRRVTTTLAALAAAGGFDPDPPGALASDREAPGFGVAGFAPTSEASLNSGAGAGADLLTVRPANEVSPSAPQQRPSLEAGAPRQAEERVERTRAAEQAERAKERAKQDEEERARQHAARARLKQEAEEAQRARQRAEQEARARLEAARAERAKQQAERQRLEQLIQAARGALEASSRDAERLRRELASAENSVEQALGRLRELESQLATVSRVIRASSP